MRSHIKTIEETRAISYCFMQSIQLNGGYLCEIDNCSFSHNPLQNCNNGY